MNHKSLRRKATRSARADRSLYWSQLACSMEEYANKGDIGKVFRQIKKVAGKKHAMVPSLRDSDGQLISCREKVAAHWVEHFDSVFNCTPPSTTELALSPMTTYEANCEAPSKEEITRAIRQLKDKKAPGEDGIPAELLKHCVGPLLEPIHKLFKSIWIDESCLVD